MLPEQNNIELISPPKNMFGDNAAMIAWACIKKLQKGDFKENIYFKADPRLQITQKINEILVTNDLEPDISFVSFISLATSFGSVKYMLSPSTTFLVELAPARVNGVSEP